MDIPTLVAEIGAVNVAVSTINKYLIQPRWPRVAAAIAPFCAIAPGDIGKVLSEISSLLPGGAAQVAAKRIKADKRLSTSDK